MSFHLSSAADPYGSMPRGRQARPLLDPLQLSAEERKFANVTLVVVDMQPRFSDAIDQRLLGAVERQILLAKLRHWAIVSLEFDPWRNGPTFEQLKRHLDGYQRHTMRVKSGDSGACQVTEACLDFRYPMRYFRVCGVYTDACVLATVRGLLAHNDDCAVRVIKEACNTNYCREGQWCMFPKAPRAVISSESIDGSSGDTDHIHLAA